MNTIAHVAGLIGCVWLMRLSFGELSEPLLGWAMVVVSLWMVGMAFRSAYTDFSWQSDIDEEGIEWKRKVRE